MSRKRKGKKAVADDEKQGEVSSTKGLSGRTYFTTAKQSKAPLGGAAARRKRKVAEAGGASSGSDRGEAGGSDSDVPTKKRKQGGKKGKKAPAAPMEDSGSEGWEEIPDGWAEDDKPVAKKRKRKDGVPKKKEPSADSGDGIKVFVGGIPWSTTEEELREHFKGVGQIADIEMPAKRAYVSFKTGADLDKVLKLDGKAFGGNMLMVKTAGKGNGKGNEVAKTKEVKKDWRKKKGKGKGKGKKKANSGDD
eukprot:gnl/TRDRNA2_/TRDRNA2_186644_c0_seq1.p1 gnl/TRDRNA2_/TRDRNA2_186644_c0~~gnl/TRDRNA2_/TRDRNA2_186644_c0_seq1.p1  ORF type:complete len:249 (-),score=81.99 gnl/TRDRNA2_/TRDRNA2_186644_c0_seq1:19-765(-)